MSVIDSSIQTFLNELSSKAPTPGGGSVAALAGALAAGLVGMVCHLTVGKKGYEDFDRDMQALLSEAERLRSDLVRFIDEDVAVFGEYSRASKMPKGNEQEKTQRAVAVQAALMSATEVPLRVVDTAVQVMNLCRPCAEKGNKWAVSDAGVAVVLAEGAARSGALNVLINLGAIHDANFVQEKRSELESHLQGTSKMRDDIYDYVVSKL
jgi:methenyltetrahydrofolate cyclohydrolase